MCPKHRGMRSRAIGASETLANRPGATRARDLGTEIDNAFGPDRAATPREAAGPGPGDAQGLSATSYGGSGGGGGGDGEAADLEAYIAANESLGEFLTRQSVIVIADPGDRIIAASLIDAVDEAGYVRGDLSEIAERLGVTLARVEAVLARFAVAGTDRGVRARPRGVPQASTDRARPASTRRCRRWSRTYPHSLAAIMRCCVGSAASTTRISPT